MTKLWRGASVHHNPPTGKLLYKWWFSIITVFHYIPALLLTICTLNATHIQLTNHVLFLWQNSCWWKYSTVSTMVGKFLTSPTGFYLQHTIFHLQGSFFFLNTKKIRNWSSSRRIPPSALTTRPFNKSTSQPCGRQGRQSSHLHLPAAILLASFCRAVSLALPSMTSHHMQVPYQIPAQVHSSTAAGDNSSGQPAQKLLFCCKRSWGHVKMKSNSSQEVIMVNEDQKKQGGEISVWGSKPIATQL